VEGSCEHGDEPLGFLKCWEVYEWLHNWQFLRKGSASCVSKVARVLISLPDAAYPKTVHDCLIHYLFEFITHGVILGVGSVIPVRLRVWRIRKAIHAESIFVCRVDVKYSVFFFSNVFSDC
jgi:hypothetical protein